MQEIQSLLYLILNIVTMIPILSNKNHRLKEYMLEAKVDYYFKLIIKLMNYRKFINYMIIQLLVVLLSVRDSVLQGVRINS